jgi:hypothetical protein
LAGLTGVRPAEATAKRGDSKHRVRASSYDEKVVVCLRVGNGTHRRIKVAQRAARKLLSKHGNFRFVDCCVDRDCKDGETCGAGTCTAVCGAEGETCTGDAECCSGMCACGISTCTCAVPCRDSATGCEDNSLCGCPTDGTPGASCTCRAARCAVPGETCATNFDCCDGTCVCLGDTCTCDCINPGECASGHCGCSTVRGFDVCTCRPKRCRPTGGTCAVDTDCCDGPCVCQGDDCACVCVANGEACASDAACCSGQCLDGYCRETDCAGGEEGCLSHAECCYGLVCAPGVCFAGDCDGQSCETDADCCGGSCGGRVCVAGGEGGCAGRCRG